MIDRLNSYTVLASAKVAARQKDFALEAPNIAFREQQDMRRSQKIASVDKGKIEVTATKLVSNPIFVYNKDLSRVIVEFHDAETGDVKRQIPTEGQIAAYQDSEVRSQKSETRGQLSGSSEVIDAEDEELMSVNFLI